MKFHKTADDGSRGAAGAAAGPGGPWDCCEDRFGRPFSLHLDLAVNRKVYHCPVRRGARKHAVHAKTVVGVTGLSATRTFVVTGEDRIHCESCEARVANALKRLPGVKDVHASHKTQEVNVTFDPGDVSGEDIRARLADLGYEVSAPGT